MQFLASNIHKIFQIKLTKHLLQNTCTNSFDTCLKTYLCSHSSEKVISIVSLLPDTSRPRKEEEIDGKDYYFVSRHTFEQDITDHKFVEFGEYEKNLYGTSLESIRYVVGTGKISILNLDPQVSLPTFSGFYV